MEQLLFRKDVRGMTYTKFGEFVRLLRVKNHEVMGDMARFLGTSTSTLSAVENGKKNVPQNWIPAIINHYNLNEAEVQALESAIEESKTHMKLNMQKTSYIKRKTALQFARSFEGMDDETAQKIMKLLEGED